MCFFKVILKDADYIGPWLANDEEVALVTLNVGVTFNEGDADRPFEGVNQVYQTLGYWN